MSKKWWTSFVIVLILGAGLVRSYALASVPATLNRDEAAIAYNALLISRVGQDEWQQKWPLTLKSFGDYKLGGYVYVVAGLFKVFGEQDVVVRVPAVVAGVAIVVLAMAIARRLGWSSVSQLVVGAAVGFGPVFIFYSRMAWEANVGLAWWLLAVWLCMWPTGQRRWWSEATAVLAVFLAGVTYNTPLLLTPLLILGLPIIRGWRRPRQWAVTTLGMGIVCAGLVVGLSAATAQKQAVTIFGDPTLLSELHEYRSSLPVFWQVVLGNKYVFYAYQAGWRWLASWSPQFLVWHGGSHPWHQVPGTGHILLVTYGLGLIGLLLFLGTHRQWRSFKTEQSRWQGWWWLVTGLSLWPAMITVDAPHATRSLLFMVALGIWSGWGWQQLSTWLPSRVAPKIATLILTGVLLTGVGGASWYLWRYFAFYPEQSRVILQAGLPAAIKKVEMSYPGQAVAVVDEDGYTYAQVAWILKLPPTAFFQSVIKQAPSPVGLQYGQQVGRYHFIAKPSDRQVTEPILVQWSGQEWKVYDFGSSSNPQ